MFDDIVPVKQAFRHCPEKEVYGDCHRTAIAIILGRDRDDIPNFGHGCPGSEVFSGRVDKWMSDHNLSSISVIFSGETDLDEVIATMDYINPGRPAILGGQSKTGVNHSVVIQHGKIAADPSIDEAGIVGPTKPDGFYWITYIVGNI